MKKMKPIGAIPFFKSQIEKSRNYAIKVTPTLRDRRPGGRNHRSIKQIQEDNFQGKLGEFGLVNLLNEKGVYNIGVDLEIYGKDIGDKGDIIINNKTISVKSTKIKSKYLMIEVQNLEVKEIPDFIFLVRVYIDNYENPNPELCYAVIDGYIGGNEFFQISELKPKESFIPNTGTPLDADNYILHRKNLKRNWDLFIKMIKGKNPLTISNFFELEKCRYYF